MISPQASFALMSKQVGSGYRRNHLAMGLILIVVGTEKAAAPSYENRSEKSEQLPFTVDFLE